MPAEQHLFGHTGHFIITTPPGGPTLNAFLTIPPNGSSVTGHGILTNTSNPPLHANNAFVGVVHALNGPQIYSLQGHAIPPLLGATHVTQLLIELDKVWGGKGRATYAYITGAVFHEVREAKVEVNWLLQA